MACPCERVVSTAQALEPEKIYVVYGNGGQQVRQQMKHLSVEWIEQNQRLGTGHAVLQVIDHIPDEDMVLVLYGDVPLVRVELCNNYATRRPSKGWVWWWQVCKTPLVLAASCATK